MRGGYLIALTMQTGYTNDNDTVIISGERQPNNSSGPGRIHEQKEADLKSA